MKAEATAVLKLGADNLYIGRQIWMRCKIEAWEILRFGNARRKMRCKIEA